MQVLKDKLEPKGPQDNSHGAEAGLESSILARISASGLGVVPPGSDFSGRARLRASRLGIGVVGAFVAQ